MSTLQFVIFAVAMLATAVVTVVALLSVAVVALDVARVWLAGWRP